MTRQEVERARAEWSRAQQAVMECIREHNRTLSPLLQRQAQLENAYFAASRELHAELDAKGR